MQNNLQKIELRNRLFNKFFDNDEGIFLKDLVCELESYVDTWLYLKELLVNGIKDFSEYRNIEKFKILNKDNNNYIIIKLMPWEYLILDINNKKVINNNEARTIFNEQFFIDNFDKVKYNNMFKHYYFFEYNGDIDKLITFCLSNQNILSNQNYISYKVNIGEAYSYIYIDLTDGKVQLSFQTKDQFLYEQLFMNGDLTPSGLQDATEKIGKERMFEMFENIPKIKIPYCVIPEGIITKNKTFSKKHK